jgi:hypothetical protein
MYVIYLRIISLLIFLLPMLVYANPSSDMLERLALVDTGYDVCMNLGGNNCADNKNILLRGDQPLPDDAPFDFNFAYFRDHVLSYMQTAKSTYQINASLPLSDEDLKNYRIVVINLLYDFKANGGDAEFTELENEFKNSGAVPSLQIPEQHKIYGLDSAFRPDHYAFMWWPIQLSSIEETDPEFISLSLNWPAKQGTPVHDFKPDVYKPLNFPSLISGKNFFGVNEYEAASLHTLLASIPQDGHPLLIYYHCVAGKDRTGATSVAYFMTYGGYPFIPHTATKQNRQHRSQPLSLDQALIATTIPEHPADEFAEKLARAYCKTLGKNPDDCEKHKASL